MVQAVQIDPRDIVATLLDDVARGGKVEVGGRTITAGEAIPRGHKVAVRDIAPGDPIFKYGHPIGSATASIEAGCHVHSHNMATLLTGTADYHFEGGCAGPAPRKDDVTFKGYVRPDGRVATRNEIWVLPTVGCVARTAQRIAREMDSCKPEWIDGVYAFAHPFGCSQLGEDLAATRTLIAGLAAHPNAGGVLIVGLGCEENQIEALLEEIPQDSRASLRTLTSQLTVDEVADGCTLIRELFETAVAVRQPVGIDRLVIGVKCGGSDGLSGLTANPLVGRISDRITAAGGTIVLTEIPEMFGAETVLLERSSDRAVFDRLASLVNNFKEYFLAHGEPVSENPSPGNVEGGITTLEEKSLGAIQKGGRALVSDVIDYGRRATRSGLTVLEAPGNDAVSATALVAAGATMILFTTGRGTPLGFPVPTLKIASNSELAQRKPNWIDFDAGAVLDQGFDITTEALLTRICAFASGELTGAERNDEREIALWKRGVTL